MNVHIALLPILFCVGALANGAFNYDDGENNKACPFPDDPFHPFHLQHPDDCNKFYKCFDGKAFLMSCPKGQEFAKHYQRCEFPENANCHIENPVLPPEISTDPILKPAPEAVPKPEPEAVPESEPLPEPEENSEESVPEISPEPAQFSYDNGVLDSRCPIYDDPYRPVHLPSQASCSMFYKCSSGKAYAISCPPGQEYGVALNRCDFPIFAKCSSFGAGAEFAGGDLDYDSDEELTSEEILNIVGIDDERCPPEDDPEDIIHFSHPEDCEKFYKCANGKAYRMSCPVNQHWSVKYGRCEFPKVAKCKMANN